MATFIPGITDFIPQVQPWQPDLGFYQAALQRKQSQYDAAYNKVSSLYGSLLNSPMLRPENIKRRDEFFKAIDNDIKRISTLDLSLQQNQDAAMELFRPFYEDENIVTDMAWTRRLNTQMQKGQSYKGCLDPKKCNGQYWDGGMEYLNYMAEEFANSTDEEAKRFKSPEYIPAQNLTKDLMDYAFKNKIQITTVNDRGGFMVTEQNGRQAYLPLSQTFKALATSNPGALKYMEALSYLDRKRTAKQNAYLYGGDEKQAEIAYIQKTVADNKALIEKQYRDADSNSQYLNAKAGAIKSHIEQNGTTADSDLSKELVGLLNEINKSDQVTNYAKSVAEQYNREDVASGDLNALRSQFDAIRSNGYLMENVYTAAKNYADDTYKEKREVNPYVLENVKFKNDIIKSDRRFQQQVALKGMEFQNKKEEIYLRALAKQIGAENLKKQSNTQFTVQGPAELNEFKPLNAEESASTSTGTEDVDIRKETLSKFQESYDQVNVINADILEKSLMYLQNQARSANDSGLAAKLELKKMLGKNYDVKTNEFKNNNGVTVADVAEFVDPTKINVLAGTTLATIKSNPLYKDFYSANLSGLEAQAKTKKDVQDAHLANYVKSNLNIKAWAQSANEIDAEDKPAFDLLFDKSGAILNQKEYAKRYLEKFGEDDGEDMYEDMFEMYEGFYKNGALGAPGGPKIIYSASPLVGGSMFTEGSTGKTTTGGKARFNGLFSSSNANIGIITFARNAEDKGREKAVFGNDIIADDYEDEDDSETAFALFKAIANDLDKGGFKARDKGVPTGQIYYRGIAANNPNLVAVTIVPDEEYLGKFLKTKKNPNGILNEDQLQSASKGVTLFMDRAKATDNLFYKMSSQGDYEIIANSGKSIPLNIDNTSKLTFRKVNGKNVVDGFIYQNYIDERGKMRTKELNASNVANVNTTMDAVIENLLPKLAILKQQNDLIVKEHQEQYGQQELIYDINQIIGLQGGNQ